MPFRNPTPSEPVSTSADPDPERPKATDRTDSGSPRKRWYRRPRFYVALFVVSFLGWQLAGLFVAHSYLSADYHRVWPRETPGDRGLVSIDVTIPVPGVRDDRGGPLHLAGWFFPADPAAAEFQNGALVILTHGFNSAKGKVWTDPSIGYRGSLSCGVRSSSPTRPTTR